MRERAEEIGKKNIYMIFVLWFGSEILYNSTLDTIVFWQKADFNNAINLIITCLLMMQIIIFQKYSTKEMIIIALMSGAVAYATYNSGINTMMSTWLFVVASKQIEFDRIVLVSYLLILVLSVMIVYLFINDYIDETVIYRGGMVRHSLGFSHPNLLGLRLFQFGAAHAYMRREKISFGDFLIIISLIVFIYRVPNCQTAYYSLSILLLFLILKKFFEMVEGGIQFFSKCLIFLAGFVNLTSVLFSIIDVRGNKILSKLDYFISHRFSWCHKVYSHYGISLFGQEINLYKLFMNHLSHRFYLDSSYMSILLRYGVVVYLCFTFLYIATMYIAYRKKQYMLIVMLCLYAVYGVMENSFYSLAQNTFLLSLGVPLYNWQDDDSHMDVIRTKVRFRIV